MIIPKSISPRQSLKKSFLKQKPRTKDFEEFKKALVDLLESIVETESEEHNKKPITTFLNTSFYKENYINTKKKTDLVIYLGKDAKSKAGVLIEVKHPCNKQEMITKENLNARAMHESILYYMRERIEEKNDEVKHIIITNAYEWFVFDAQQFEKYFYKNNALKKEYETWVNGGKVSNKTEHFYKEIAPKALTEIDKEIEFTYFDLRDYKKLLTAGKEKQELIYLFKVLHPHHLLKEAFAGDSNQLDKQFYQELLHIIGLEEIKDGSKKLIDRKVPERRDEGSLIENAINKLKAKDVLRNIQKPEIYGAGEEQQLYNIALELCITWVNRILFLKLLEAQLVNYHNGSREYKFLDAGIIKQYDDLHELFHEVLAVKTESRTKNVWEKFKNIPYLNSSLFEISDLERTAIDISGLKDRLELNVYNQTILKNDAGKKQDKPLSTLEYLLKFLDAYDFASENIGEETRDDDKRLISASVLGLIFEKINGYKEGSFFTPGFITMYMCRETLRRAVIQKFNEAKGWNCGTIKELRDKIEYQQKDARLEANKIINSIKICDPAVGSGHFLVSALNELIAIKSELNVLCYRNGERLKEYEIVIDNDELIVTDIETDELFEYRLNKNGNIIEHMQKVQETLFHEKETIIENCLFGVDINPNSVNICRLRLWIELLKNAYYLHTRINKDGIKKEILELNTLPNIDINIKQGNSLISRFKLDADLKKALKTIKYSIEDYKMFVRDYRTAKTKEDKRNNASFIDEIKKNFRFEISNNDPRRKKLNDLVYELHTKFQTERLIDIELSEKDKIKLKKDEEKLEAEIVKKKKELDDEENGEVYRNAFEWRFEFPEVLDDEGNFVGFDVVIGNPPYIPLENMKSFDKEYFRNKYKHVERKYESSVLFILDGFEILKEHGESAFIAPVTWQTGENYSYFREYILTKKGLKRIINLPFDIFEDAYVETAIYWFSNYSIKDYEIFCFDKKTKVKVLDKLPYSKIAISMIKPPSYKIILDQFVNNILTRIGEGNYNTLGDITISTQGLSGNNFLPVKIKDGKDIFPYLNKGNVYNYTLVIEEVFQTSLKEKPSLKTFYDAKPKLLIRRIINRQDRLSVGFTEEKMVFKKDINPFIPINSDFNPRFLLALLSSRLLSYLYINTSSIASKDDFRQTTLAELRSLLIPKVSIKEQKPFISIVDKILAAKKENPQADTSALEKEIDAMVYKLYGLTEEEIKIVEGK